MNTAFCVYKKEKMFLCASSALLHVGRLWAIVALEPVKKKKRKEY